MIARDLLVILAVALGVYLPKLIPLVVLRGQISPGLRRWLKYVAPAVLSALVAPAILVSGGSPAVPSFDLVAYLAAFLVAIVTRRMLPSLGAGLLIVILVTLVRGASGG